ncbi:winged helix-turn-helix domain-containing protein [Variovorax sp. YR752]|uniref:winged helix-turn-helix transcriptional regulator n=1 Tax=Variovorax sp. YR752 TaxID=1884383 RepID=UPI00313848FD
MRFLVLSPDDTLAANLTAVLRAAGHEAVRLRSLPDVHEPLPRADAVLAQLTGPALDGADLSASLRRIVAVLPVLVVGEPPAGAPGAEHVDASADAGLLAERLIALGQRPAAPPRGRWLGGELDIDLVREVAMLDGVRVDLTPIEWRITATLAAHEAHAVPRAALARLIGGDAGEASDNAVAVHLYNLRRKLGRHAIETIRGRGFRLRR